MAAAAGGRLLDGRGGRSTFLVGGLGGGVLLAAAATATHPAVFAVAFASAAAVIGSCGFYHVTMAAARRVAPEEPARAIAELTIWGALASPVFLPLTGGLVGVIGWRPTLGVLAATTAAGLAVGATLAGGGRASPPAHDEVGVALRVAVREASRDPAVRRLLVAICGTAIAHGVILTFQVPVMVALGMPLATASAIAGARGFMQLGGRVGLGRLVARTGARRALAGVTLGSVLAAGLLAGSSTVAVGLAFAVVAGVTMGADSPLAGIHAAELLPERHLGALMGALHSARGAAGALGPLIGGASATTFGSYLPAVALAGVAFTVAGLALVLPTRTGPARPPPHESTPHSHGSTPPHPTD